MDLETNIIDIDDSTMASLFDETPAKTPGANELVGAQKPEISPQEGEEDTEQVEEIVKPKAVTKANIREDVIENLNLDDIQEEYEEEEEEVKPLKKKEVAKKEEPEIVEDTTKGEEVLSVLKSTVDFLIESGQWQDFEGREELDVTEEVYAKLVAQQDSLRVTKMFDELIDSTGPFGKAIIDFVKNGGSPDEIIDLFKEQKQVESLNLDSADGQKDLVKQYYADVLGWKPDKIEKHLSRLMLSGELEDEAKEVKDMFGTFYKKEAERLNAKQADYRQQQMDAERAFEDNMKSTIKERKDLSLGERKTVEDYLLNYDQKLPNGNLVNKFYVNFAKMQANPADYVDLVLFVMDKQKFVQKVQTQEQSKATEKAFKFIKGNGAVSNTKGSAHDQVRKAEKKNTTLDWGLPKR